MRIISFNVNGIRSMAGKNKNGEKTGTPTNNVIKSLIAEQRPDILCFQEVKTQNTHDLQLFNSDYKYIFTNFSKSKKGYSGVVMMSNTEPEWTSYDLQRYDEETLGAYSGYNWINEGRIITARFSNFILINAYVPNSQAKLARIDERVAWEEFMRKYLVLLKKDNDVPIIYVADHNVAPDNIDIYDVRNRDKIAGASKEERAEYRKLIELGFINAFRHLHPTLQKFTYFSNFDNSRETNKGWNIDHWIVSAELADKIVDADMLNEYFGSDHVPIKLDISL